MRNFCLHLQHLTLTAIRVKETDLIDDNCASYFSIYFSAIFPKGLIPSRLISIFQELPGTHFGIGISWLCPISGAKFSPLLQASFNFSGVAKK